MNAVECPLNGSPEILGCSTTTPFVLLQQTISGFYLHDGNNNLLYKVKS